MVTAPKSKSADEATERMIHIRLTPSMHRLLRMRVADEDANIQDWVAELLEDTLKTWERTTLSRR